MEFDFADHFQAVFGEVSLLKKNYVSYHENKCPQKNVLLKFHPTKFFHFKVAMHEKCSYSEIFWSVFSRIYYSANISQSKEIFQQLFFSKTTVIFVLFNLILI